MAYTARVHEEATAGVLKLSRSWEVEVRGGAAERIGHFLELLLKWNEHVNLTGAGTLAELLGEHVPDSFALSKLCGPGERVVDVGAGGGLPGIPLALLRPDCHVTLVEPRAKRVAFLNAATREAGLAAGTVLRARVEELEGSLFSVAASRATFPAGQWLSRARRVLCPGGRAVVFGSIPTDVAPPGARLVDEVVYATRGGAPRWAASFRFT